MKIKSLLKNRKKGFTLIETFIAIVILMTAVVGPITIAQRSLNSSQYSQNRITAYYLAQDAVEYIRSVRDSIALAGNNESYAGGVPSWITSNLLSNCTGNSGCFIDYSQSPTIQACPLAGCPVLYYDPVTYYYNSNSSIVTNVPTVYTRTVKITPQNNPSPSQQDEAILTVTVSWQSSQAGSNDQVVLNQDLFNWHS